MQNFYILLAFLLITIALLIAVSIYCYLRKYRAKQKHLLPFNFTNNKSKEIIYQKWVIKSKKLSWKTKYTTFLMVSSIQNILIQIILK